MKIAHYLFITLFFLITQNYCVSQTIEALGDTNISIEELLATRGETNVIRCDAYGFFDNDYNLNICTNNEKIKADIDSQGEEASFVKEITVVDQTVFAMVDSGVFYYRYSTIRFAPYSQVEKVTFNQVGGVRYAFLKLKK